MSAGAIERGVSVEDVLSRAGRQRIEQGQRHVHGLGIALQAVEFSQRTGLSGAFGGVQVADEGAESDVSGHQ